MLVPDAIIPPRPGPDYKSFIDVNLGKRDNNALCIAHLEGDRIVVDLLRSWSSSSNRDEIPAETARVIRSYGLESVTGDRVAGDWAISEFGKHGVRLVQDAPPKSELYIALLAIVNHGAIGIPDNTTLVRQLRLLERRPRAGRDWVDLPRGAPEDESNVLAGVAHLLTTTESSEDSGFLIGDALY